MALVEVSDFQMIFRYTDYMTYIYIYLDGVYIYIYRWYLYISTYFETSFFLVALKACRLNLYQTCTASSLLPWKLLPGSTEPQQLRLSIATAQVGSFLDDDDGELASAQNKKNQPLHFGRFLSTTYIVVLLLFLFFNVFLLVNNCAPHILRIQLIRMCFFWYLCTSYFEDPINPHVFFWYLCTSYFEDPINPHVFFLVLVHLIF